MKTRTPPKILRFLRERGLWGCSATAVSLQVPGAIHTKNRAIFPFHMTVGRAKGHHTAEGLQAPDLELRGDPGFSHLAAMWSKQVT